MFATSPPLLELKEYEKDLMLYSWLVYEQLASTKKREEDNRRCSIITSQLAIKEGTSIRKKVNYYGCPVSRLVKKRKVR